MFFIAQRVIPLLLVAGRLATGTPATPAEISSPHNEVATIQGRITERDGGQPVPNAQVIVVGTRQGATTNNNGEFTIGGVAAGTVQVRAARTGYQPVVQSVTVPASGSVTANFTLERAIAHLEEVITTATGEQSRREFGNVVASVRIDSLAKIAPVTTGPTDASRARRRPAGVPGRRRHRRQ